MKDKAEMTAVVIDDHPMMRKGVIRLLEQKGNFKVVGEASNGKDALQVILKQRPDLVLLVLHSEGLKGNQTVELLKERKVESTIVLLTVSDDNDDVTTDKLPHIQVANMPSGETDINDLTKRDKEMLKQITNGQTNKHIARQLGITKGTVNIFLLCEPTGY